MSANITKQQFFEEHHKNSLRLDCKKECKYYVPPSKDTCGCKILDQLTLLQCNDLMGEYRKWEKEHYPQDIPQHLRKR